MNIELLRKIAAVIQEKPANFDMRLLHINPSNSKFVFTKDIDCKTAHCIAGWTEVITDVQCDVRTVHRLWGVSLDAAIRLCFDSAWPDKFRLRFNRAKQRRSKARIAAARIEHFIQTEGRE